LPLPFPNAIASSTFSFDVEEGNQVIRLECDSDSPGTHHCLIAIVNRIHRYALDLNRAFVGMQQPRNQRQEG
jgi:hypothetical protein